MKFNLKDIEIWSKEFKPLPTGIEFLDTRIEEMRNPQGYVADYYNFFYTLARGLEPKVVVELGSWQGTSAACFAAGSPGSLVITIDHHTDPGDTIHKQKTEEACREFPNLKYVQGWTCTQLYEEEKDKHAFEGRNAFPDVVGYIKEFGYIDILFIDSWHRYDQAKKDWDAYKPLLNSPALVICDDILKGTVGSGIDNMVKFWDELKGEKFLNGNLHKGYPMGFLKV